jgi:hypothetical protein
LIVLASRVLKTVRAVSAWLYACIMVVLLGAVYVLVLPWFAGAWRLRSRRSAGWSIRNDPGVASNERLRSPF